MDSVLEIKGIGYLFHKTYLLSFFSQKKSIILKVKEKAVFLKWLLLAYVRKKKMFFARGWRVWASSKKILWKSLSAPAEKGGQKVNKIEKIRRQKRKRSKRAKLKMLEGKKKQSQKKEARRFRPKLDDLEE